MPKSQRHSFLKTAPEAEPTKLYKILDQNFKPDLNGEFAGVRPERTTECWTVRLTEKQAKFYLDQVSIEEYNPAPPSVSSVTGSSGASGASS